MLNYAETASSSTNVPLSLIPCTLDERETGPLSSPIDPTEYVPLRIGKNDMGMVSSTLKDGYLAARKAYDEMTQTEYGAYFFLTGYEYAHLTRQYLPGNLLPIKKREWQRGFIVGWNACTFGL
jgi:hypothetical protein